MRNVSWKKCDELVPQTEFCLLHATWIQMYVVFVVVWLIIYEFRINKFFNLSNMNKYCFGNCACFAFHLMLLSFTGLTFFYDFYTIFLNHFHKFRPNFRRFINTPPPPPLGAYIFLSFITWSKALHWILTTTKFFSFVWLNWWWAVLTEKKNSFICPNSYFLFSIFSNEAKYKNIFHLM